MSSLPCGRDPNKEPEMAKGQVRGNRETRKPKKDKTAEAPKPQPGFAVKQAGTPMGFGKKDK
ncbi:hypothetical protein RRH01S_08_01640 [Rhizobium rhizogenes NBRC 13257]|uniref:Uncharacterized protein n=2 Tax=Rhizobium rhizogenes TaxID=359 RepID=B9J712_RHIR8|nr:hypothetical protein Arad_0421 [Rhizobium rhizogenes K84]GAJ94426.1 hypothetical protein RRH01S_08_01640 [Rhizobium rhizogenes NBRC 13257]